MKKIILTTFVSLFALSANAAQVRDWQMLGTDGAETAYVDRLSQHGVKNVSLTILFDYSNTPQGQSGGSAVMDYQVVCEEKFRILASADFAGNIASGKVLRTHAIPTEWQSMLTGPHDAPLPQIIQTVLSQACTAFEESGDKGQS